MVMFIIQVQGVGNEVPHIMTLQLYVPEVNQELPDWAVMEPELEDDRDQVKGPHSWLIVIVLYFLCIL